MDREQAREEALRRAIRRRKGRDIEPPLESAEPKSGMIPRMSMRDKLKMDQRRRQAQQAAGMLTGGQAKIAAKAPPPNKITGADFAVLRKEKAKGRGQGLQDEKLKPGEVVKARGGGIAIKGTNFKGVF